MDEARANVVYLDLNDILPNRFQPRIKFNEDSIIELSESIKEHGVIQPVVVRPIGDKYEIIAGERRYKASVLAGKDKIPAIVTNLDDKNSAEVALIENVQRKDLTPIEEAISYKKILDMGYLTQEQLAIKLGKSQSTIANKVRLLNLCDEGQEALMDENISERHARSLLRLDSFTQQREILKKVIDERLTVRKTDEEIDKMNGENNISVESPEQEIDENTFSPSNPGFVDVERIEESAQDIEEPKKEVNFGELLSAGAIPQPEPIQPEPAKEEPPQAETNPFDFDMPGAGSVLVEDSPAPIGIDSIVQLPAEPVPVQQETPQPEPVHLEIPQPEPIQPEPIAVDPPQEPTEEKKVSFADLLAPQGEVPQSTPIPQPEPLGMPTMSPIDQPLATPIDTEPIVEEALPSRFLNTGSSEPEPEPEPIMPIAEPVPIETAPEGERPLIITDYTKQYDPVILNAPPPPPKIEFSRVINIVRDAVREIEGLGFAIDEDEINLDDIYQITIKIEKKD